MILHLHIRTQDADRLLITFPWYNRAVFILISAILIAAMTSLQRYSVISFFLLTGGLMGSGYFERWEFIKSQDRILKTIGWILPFHKKTLVLSQVTGVIINQTNKLDKRRMLSRVSLQINDNKQQLLEIVKRESQVAEAVAMFLSQPCIRE